MRFIENISNRASLLKVYRLLAILWKVYRLSKAYRNYIDYLQIYGKFIDYWSWKYSDYWRCIKSPL